MPDLPLVGADFAGYQLRSVLGRGGMSIVYQAENPRLRNVIALKVLAPELACDQVFRTRFREESQIAASLDHPNVIPIHDFGSSGGLLYIAMRYVSGVDLRHLIAERGWLTPDAAVQLLEQAARALDAAHRRGLVHRDVKPGNLLISQGGDDGDPDHVYLADFGITKHVGGRTGLTVAGTVLGTVHYISPEQIQDLAVLGPADQYSLGCVLYECLTGQAPFERSSTDAIMWAHVHEFAAPPSLLRPDLPPAVDEVFARVLAKDAGDRYVNCREFIAAAGDALATARARPPGRWAPGRGAAGRGAAGRGAPDETARDAAARDAGARDAGARDAVARDAMAQEAWSPEEMATGAAAWDAAARGAVARGGAARDAWARGEFQSAPVPSRGLHDLGRDFAAGPREPTASVSLPAEGSSRPAFSPASGRNRRVGRVRRVRRRSSERASVRTVLALAGLAVVAAGGTAAAMLASQAGSASTGSRLTANSTSPPPSALLSALDRTEEFTGRLRLSTCAQTTATLVQCTDPDPAIASVTFATYSSLAALYAKYQEIVQNLTGHKAFTAVENVHVCGSLAPNPTAENTWNHSDQYFTKYTVTQLAAGQVPDDTAMGRVFCEQTQTGSEYMVWTQDSGRLLGYATGDASHEQVWNWFAAVHHNITFPGQPAMTGMPTAPAASASGGTASGRSVAAG